MKRQRGDFFEQLNPWWQAKNFRFGLYDRSDYTAPLIRKRDRLIHVLIGGRRVGKTSILHTVVDKLLTEGQNPRHIIFLTGELREIQELGIRAVLDQLLLRLNIKRTTPIHLFIDEAQEISKWQEDIKLLYDVLPYRIYVSGSSSLLLTRQTAKLTGRYLLRHVLPLSFKEFLFFRRSQTSASSKATMESLEEYLHIGGYPEYVLNKDPAYLRQSIESTLYRELISVYGMRNPALLQDLIYFLADKMTNGVSVKRIQKDLRVDDKTAQFYLKYLQDVYLIYPVFRTGKSHRITKGSNPKYYFNDPGVLALMAKTFRIGHAVENSVFLQLLRRQSLREVPRIEYAITDGQEVDFVCEDKWYEVKAGTDMNQEVFETYSQVGRPVEIILFGRINKFHNQSSSVSILSLRDFLLK